MKKKKKNGSNTVLERMENNMSKWYGSVLCVGENRWPKQMLICCPKEKKENGKTQNKV
jgi:hypothetical protein